MTNCQRLIGRIERCLDGMGNVFKKSDILSYCNNDWVTAVECFKQWESEGKLKILKPLDQAKDEDEVVKMKSYIEGKSPWPNWPPKD